MTRARKTAKPDKSPEDFVPQKVTLSKPHTHAGRQYRAGDEITVTDAVTLRFLVARGIA
jgi:hypothetical protein